MLKKAGRTNLLQIKPFNRAKLLLKPTGGLPNNLGELQMFRRKLLFVPVVIALFFLAACQSGSPTSETPSSSSLGDRDVNVLQEKPYGSGQLLLTSWHDENGASCMAGTYLTRINDTLEPHDTALSGCQSDAVFQAAYTGNSRVEQFAGAPRHTTVFGRSDVGHAVRIVWQDGQVNHVPLENHSFLEARDGRWAVERIELLDDQNNIILAEEWTGNGVQATN